MAKVGRPPKYDKDFHPQDLIKCSENGWTIARIAASWGITRETYYAWCRTHPEFSDSNKKGREIAEAWWISIGQDAILGQLKSGGKKINPNVGLYVWMTKNLFKWSDHEKNASNPSSDDAVYDVEFGDGSSAPKT